MSMSDRSDETPDFFESHEILRPPTEDLADHLDSMFAQAQEMHDAETARVTEKLDPDNPRVMFLDNDFGNSITSFLSERILLAPPFSVVTLGEEIMSHERPVPSRVHVFRPKILLETDTDTDDEPFDEVPEDQVDDNYDGFEEFEGGDEATTTEEFYSPFYIPRQYVLYFETPMNERDACYVLHETSEGKLTLEPYDDQITSMGEIVDQALVRMFEEIADMDVHLQDFGNFGDEISDGDNLEVNEKFNRMLESAHLPLQILADLKKLRPTAFQPQ